MAPGHPPCEIVAKRQQAADRLADLKVQQANARAKSGGTGRPRRFS
jgi:hypothetical protein